MGQPRFSVVIPTRGRTDTLRATLTTCLNQDFEDYEVVVCDNDGPPSTRELIEQAGSPKIRYHRSPKPLTMVDNWNLAYSLCRGEYVLFLGDDDGLMPYALGELEAIVRRHGVPAVRWDWAVYAWPDIAVEGAGNYLGLPLARGERVVESRRAIADVMAGRAGPEMLPNVYHSLVARTVLEQVRQTAGNVFSGWYPDTFTSFAVASLIDRHTWVTVPMTVIGLSSYSNMVAAMFRRNKHPVAREYRAANDRSGIRLHPWVPDLPLLWVVLSDSFLGAKPFFFPDDDTLVLDRRLLAERCIEEMPADDLDEQQWVMRTVRETLRDDDALLGWFDARFAERIPPPRPPVRFGPERLGFDGDRLHLSAAAFGVSDVAGAADLIRNLLGFGGRVAYDLPTRQDLIAWAQSDGNRQAEETAARSRQVEEEFRADAARAYQNRALNEAQLREAQHRLTQVELKLADAEADWTASRLKLEDRLRKVDRNAALRYVPHRLAAKFLKLFRG